jgi:DNA-binding NarL/FixJ family response regulator
MHPITVLLVEDLSLMRQGIQSALREVPDVTVVGEAADGEEAVRLAEKLRPTVVLMDQDMPVRDGLEATRLIKQSLPDVEVIVMTDRLDDTKALQAIEAGATGYILKDIPGPNLVTALRSVCNGQAYFHREITRKLVSQLNHLTREEKTRRRLESEGLTLRELDILIELAKGSTDKQIAGQFVVAEGTVKTHIRHILRKLDCRNRTQAVAHVLRRGLIK